GRHQTKTEPVTGGHPSCGFARNPRHPTEICKPVEDRGARSIPSGHITGGRACLEIAGASKRPERGKSPDARGAPRSFHGDGEVEKTGIANDRDSPRRRSRYAGRPNDGVSRA